MEFDLPALFVFFGCEPINFKGVYDNMRMLHFIHVAPYRVALYFGFKKQGVLYLPITRTRVTQSQTLSYIFHTRFYAMFQGLLALWQTLFTLFLTCPHTNFPVSFGLTGNLYFSPRIGPYFRLRAKI